MHQFQRQEVRSILVSIFLMGNGYKLAAITYIKGMLFQTITSQEEKAKRGAEKRELFSAQFTILLVISGLKMSAQDVFAQGDLCTLCLHGNVLVCMTEHLPKAAPFSLFVAEGL